MSTSTNDAVLDQILAQLNALQVSQQTLQTKLDALTTPPPPHSPQGANGIPIPGRNECIGSPSSSNLLLSPSTSLSRAHLVSSTPPTSTPPDHPLIDKEREKALYPGRVVLATYPDQHGIKPYPLQWGASDPAVRGPVICSRLLTSIKQRNALGAHSGSYSIYRALAIAMGTLNPTHKPDYTKTEPPVPIPPQPSWYDPNKIVSFDPWGHLVPQVFKKEIDDLVERARRVGEKGDLNIDGRVVLRTQPLKNADGSLSDADPGVEIAISKAAVEPVWYLPGVAERFGISETLLRRALFEDTGGMYPELITRPDIKVFLPPIGNLTVYIFGHPEYMSDESKELTLRVHDECNGSDVFGSDICTCKPYLIFAIEECIRCVQRGGVGVVVYFRKEGRALGEVTKYLVYNLRKRGGDSADKYFKSTELIAGVKDMRFQALMPDVLHWLGIKKIDNMVSMSDMKYNAIVQSGIPILNRYDLPEHLIPPDSRVEIDAKIAAGYFTSGKQVAQADLFKTVGRTWEETEH
ncbi:GTP cyclohydrolase N terminal-domain-containing protein [Boletus reticuloceps]|uniref:GTP cyclohydrolase N terminal-domain-containing protein n=1 Tax=Boletus reticuloceps TaxID=495285 RepID=A0A8I2YET8_9AGAM|nr:GTP cyclohydrolase N terminal-domain-containing protein [Boletus reticuloceps]